MCSVTSNQVLFIIIILCLLQIFSNSNQVFVGSIKSYHHVIVQIEPYSHGISCT